MFWFIVWVLLSILVGIYANSKGRLGFGFFLTSIVLSPIIGFLAALIAVPHEDKIMKNKDLKKCPYCKELIKNEATICKYCHKELNENTTINRNVLKKFENNTYKTIIENPLNSDFLNIKNTLINQYKNKGFSVISLDDNKNFKLKRDDDKLGYIKLSLRNNILSIEAYNVEEEPLISLI